MKHLTLYELNNIVRSTLAATLEPAYWVVAELSEVRPAARGHCYMEFVEKDEATGAMVAKARGVVWSNVWPLLDLSFEKATGRHLSPGMKVLVQVGVSFHELYGYSLTVTDIDPTYTLGDAARRRREIIDRLTADGVLMLNKELPLPRPLRRIAVISSATAAGYGDFCNQLEQSGYPFALRLFPAAMQGERLEATVIAALDAIAAEAHRWDAVAIIRGGGAVSDLNSFDAYDLANNVAQFPLPVLTGIGHERDDTVIDIVAHTRLKTPTAVAAFLIDARRAEVQAVDALSQRLERAARTGVERAGRQYDAMTGRLQVAALHYLRRQSAALGATQQRLLLAVPRRLPLLAARADRCEERLRMALKQLTARERQRLDHYERIVAMASPEQLLKRGYTMTLKDGRLVTDAARLSPGDRLTTVFAHGTAQSVVDGTTADA